MASRQVAARAVNWAALASRVPKGETAAFDELRIKFETSKGTLNTMPEQPTPIDWDHYTGVVKNTALVEKFRAAHADIVVPYPEDDWSTQIAAAKVEQLAKDTETRQQLEEGMTEAKAEIHKITNIPGYESMATMVDYLETNPALKKVSDERDLQTMYVRIKVREWLEEVKQQPKVVAGVDSGLPLSFVLPWEMFKELFVPLSVEEQDIAEDNNKKRHYAVVDALCTVFPEAAEKLNELQELELQEGEESLISKARFEHNRLYNELIDGPDGPYGNSLWELDFQQDPKGVEAYNVLRAQNVGWWDDVFAYRARATARGEIYPGFKDLVERCRYSRTNNPKIFGGIFAGDIPRYPGTKEMEYKDDTGYFDTIDQLNDGYPTNPSYPRSQVLLITGVLSGALFVTYHVFPFIILGM